MSWMLLAALFVGSLVAANALSPTVALALAVTLGAWAWQRQQARLDQLEARLRQQRPGVAEAAPPAAEPSAAAGQAEADTDTDTDTAPMFLVTTAAEPQALAAAQAAPEAVRSSAPRQPAATPPSEDTSPATTSSLGATLRAWVLGGNTIVRLAVLILFVGVAFLVRYAADHALLPIELRLAAVVLGGMAAVGIGWRLRHSRRDYALTLQGGGIGVIYLVLFAALRLYGLLPPGLAFALLVALSALTAVLALGQDAMVLAVVAFAGAFLAPVLTATGQGSHVMLFSYYGVLNLTIAWLAQRRAWKLLNAVGFVFTFGIGLAWGLRNWQPELLASTEPFLVAHLLLYLFITVQYSRQLLASAAAATTAKLAIVDGSLLFGVPIAAFGMQAAMVRHLEYGVAISAAVLAGVYLLLARWLWQRLGERMRVLTEGMLALGVVFLALVAPLALDERWTAAAWALQGAGVAWVALRQRRAAALGLGLVLQLLAAVQFWGQAGRASGVLFMANAHLAGAVLLGVSALFTARQMLHAAAAAPGEPLRGVQRLFKPLLLQRLHHAALGLGLLHAFAGLSAELPFAPFAHPALGERNTLLLAAFALALEGAQQRLAWPALRVAARCAMAAALVLVSFSAVMAWRHVAYTGAYVELWPHYRDGALLSLATLLAAALWLLRRLDISARTAHTSHPAEHGLWHGAALLHAALLAYALGGAFINHHQAWTPSLALAAPLALMLWFLARQSAGQWPSAQHPRSLQWGLAWPLLGLGLLWLLAVNLHADGAMQPLPYLPLVNPIDLGHALLALYAWRLWRSTQRPAFIAPKVALALGAVAGFVWLNAMVVRSLHHWAGTPLWLHGAWHAGAVQTAFTILWSLCALATMFVATRRKWRLGWMAGAALLGGVVLKLALVDLSHTGALLRIVSFIAVGLLMLLIGYLSPLPPARKEAV